MAKLLAKNIGFMAGAQFANYLLPLVTIPYITRVAGPENYGLIEFATVTMLYFSALVIYGFNFTATRKIARLSAQGRAVAGVFYQVFYVRLLLFGLSALLLLLLVFLLPQMRERAALLFYAFPVVLGWALYPDFLFQGLQKLKVVAWSTIAVKFSAALLIFVFLRYPEQFYRVVLINGLAQLLVGIAALAYAWRSENLGFEKPRWPLMKAFLASGWYLFLSHFFTRIYTFGSILFIGFLLPEQSMGLFAAAMKLVIVGQSFLFMPLGGALFPHFAALRQRDFAAYRRQHRRFLWLMGGVAALASAVIVGFPRFFVSLVFGDSYLPVAPYLQLMAPILALSAFSHFSQKQGLMILQADKHNLYLTIGIGLLALLLNALLIPTFALWGASWAKLLTEAGLALGGVLLFRAQLARTPGSSLEQRS